MKKLRFFNSLKKTKEEFKSIKKDKVGMYHCGPTVYDRAHIGNLRAYIFADLLRRTLEYAGYETLQVLNITDVGHLTSDSDSGEDKMTKALKERGEPLTLEAMYELGSLYEESFKEDLRRLNVKEAHHYPRASDHIAEDIELIKKLDQKGYVYQISDGLYFDTSKFEKYKDLTRVGADEDHSRVGINEEKREPEDFALWKFSETVGWESPWGKGFPGWHIECSAMSRKYLGQPFDIHTGGTDHTSIHHPNEIAQSEAAYNEPLARFWLHVNHLSLKKGKISKSEGNVIYLDDLIERGYSPLALRYLFLTVHYRSQMQFSWEALEGAEQALKRLQNFVRKNNTEKGIVSPVYKEKFVRFISDDLDIPKAVALVWKLLKDESLGSGDKRETLLNFDRVLGLNLSEVTHNEIPAPVRTLVEKREEARKSEDFEKADRIRTQILEAGYEVQDTDDGPEVVPA